MCENINFNYELASAIRDGNIERMRELVRGTQIRSSTLLHIAVEVKNCDIIRLLLSEGTNIDAYDNNNNTVLHLAVEAGNRKMILFLLGEGANVDVQNITGNTVLHLAVKKGNPIIVEDILRYRPYIGHRSNKSSLKTAICGSGERYERIVLDLLQYGFTSNPEDVRDPKFLHNAIAKECLEIVEDLLRQGANVNMLDDAEYGGHYAPLHTAVQKKQGSVAKLLLKYKAKVNARDRRGNTPIYYAVQNNDSEIAKLLLNYGANIENNQKGYIAKLLVMGKPPIFYAFLPNNVMPTELLLTKGADIEDDLELLDTTIRQSCKIVDDLSKHNRSTQLECHNYSCNYALKMLKMKLQVAGLYIGERNLEWKDFQRKCKGEIEIMKCKKISNSCVSFYNILTENTHQLAMYAKNENIVQALKSADYKAEFPIYASMIEGKFRSALRRKDLEERGNQLFHSLYPSLPELPLLSIEKIFSYLGNYHLKLLQY